MSNQFEIKRKSEKREHSESDEIHECNAFRLTLSHRVRLHVSVVVLTSPDKSSFRLHGLGHHVINQSVLIPDPLSLELRLVLPLKHIRVWLIWLNK